MRSASRQSNCFAILAGFILVLIFGPSATADIVTLKTGEVFAGHILRNTAEEVSIQLESGGILSFRANRVEHVRKSDRSEEGQKEMTAGKASGPEAKAGTGKPKALGADPGKKGPGAASPRDEPTPPTPPVKHDAAKAAAKSLAGFPLHSRRDPATPAQGPTLMESSRILDSAKGYSIIPPRGFRPWTDQRLPSMIRGFMDPATQANLTISTYSSDENLEKIKEGIVTILQEQSSAKVTKETRRTVQGPNGYNGWVLTIENSVAETTVNQLQLLAKDGMMVFIVTYSCSAKNYPACAHAFEESLESFRIEGRSAAGGTEAGSGPSASPGAGLPGPTTEEELQGYRPDTKRLIQRVDERIRKSPLPYFPK